MKKIFKMVMVIVAAVVIFAAGLKIGKKKTIESAQLVRSNDTSYTIEFNGEQHDYEF